MPYWSEFTKEQGVIRTLHKTGHQFRADAQYESKIEAHQWTFRANYRHGGAYASEIFASHYLAIAKKDGFLGLLPKVVKREEVVNVDTNSIMSRFLSGSPEALDQFLTSTANGKSTQRILDLFGLKALSVTYDRTMEAGRDYYIAVELK